MTLPNTGDRELRRATQMVLDHYYGKAVRVDELTCRPSPYRTSAAVTEIDVELDDGSRVALMFKDASREAMLPVSQRAKPLFVYNPLREIELYSEVLERSQVGAPEFYGAIVDEAEGRYWLFLERVAAIELYQVGETAVWQAVAAWLARTHSLFAQKGFAGHARPGHVLQYDSSYYRVWLDRALTFFRAVPADDGVGERLEWLAAHVRPVVEHLKMLPVTLLHGEFYASNILVQTSADDLRVCPIDWEMAAVGPGLFDLAALVSGNWTPAERAAIAGAYYDAMSERDRPSWDGFLAGVTCCRVQQAVQWLGWYGRRRAPRGNAAEWLNEAIDGIRELGVAS